MGIVGPDVNVSSVVAKVPEVVAPHKHVLIVLGKG